MRKFPCEFTMCFRVRKQHKNSEKRRTGQGNKKSHENWFIGQTDSKKAQTCPGLAFHKLTFLLSPACSTHRKKTSETQSDTSAPCWRRQNSRALLSSPLLSHGPQRWQISSTWSWVHTISLRTTGNVPYGRLIHPFVCLVYAAKVFGYQIFCQRALDSQRFNNGDKHWFTVWVFSGGENK